MRRKWKQLISTLMAVVMLASCLEPYEVMAEDGDVGVETLCDEIEVDDEGCEEDECSVSDQMFSEEDEDTVEEVDFEDNDNPEEKEHEDIELDEEDLVGLSSVRQRIIELAYDEMGYLEEKSKGNNWNKYADELNKAGWTCPQSAAWCAIFVAWLVYKAGVDRDLWPTSFSSTNLSLNWFKERGRWYDKVNYTWGNSYASGGGGIDNYDPQPGDFVAIETDGNKGNGPDHTGVVFSYTPDEDLIVTIEGNSSVQGSSVEGVDCHYYYWNSSAGVYRESAGKWIVGVAEPEYPDDPPVNDWAINFPFSSMDLKVGETKSFTFSFSGTGINSINGWFSDGYKISAVFNSIDWTKSPVPVNISVTGKEAGNQN